MNQSFGREQKKLEISPKKEIQSREKSQLLSEIRNACSEVKIHPKEKIEARFTKGIIDGEKIVTIAAKDEKTILSTYWDIKLTGMMGMFTGMIKKHIKSGTEQAMQSIKKEIER